jgi:hypothetical protein
MPRRIEHRHLTAASAEAVAEVLADEAYLRARLERLGGEGARLLEHRKREGEIAYRSRQGVGVERLPTVARALLAGDLVVSREETLRRERPGYWVGVVKAVVIGAPVTVDGEQILSDVDDSGADGSSMLAIDVQLNVRIPLMGGTIERLVSDQLRRLLVAEAQFTDEWLADND